MKIFSWGLIVLIAVSALVALNSFYVVRQDQQALVLQVGQPKAVRNAPGTDEAGLYFKAPFIQTVEVLDRKNLGLDIDNIAVLASDQRSLKVDAFVRWRIRDPLQFFESFRTISRAEIQLGQTTRSNIREALGDVPVPEIVSGQRSQLMDRIREGVNSNLTDDGIDIIDVRIRQADLPDDVAEGVYNRMKTARLQEAQRVRAVGEEKARLIRATAAREKVVLEAQAGEKAQTIRGEGDAKSTAIYAKAYNKDPEFFRFQRALIACEASIQEGTQIIVGPDGLGICDDFIKSAARNGGR